MHAPFSGGWCHPTYTGPLTERNLHRSRGRPHGAHTDITKSALIRHPAFNERSNPTPEPADASRTLESVSVKTAGSKAYSLLMFGVVSILAGVLVAGLGVPFAALAAGATRAGAATLKEVPANLAVPDQYEASTMYLSDGL